MNEKQLDKWFQDSKEVGEIDDFLRTRPDFSWFKLKYQAKLDFYNAATGEKIQAPKQIVATAFPNIQRRVTTTRQETLEGHLIKETYQYEIVGKGSQELIDAYIQYGLLAPLPYTETFEHDDKELESILSYVQNYFSRSALSKKDKQEDRNIFWREIKNKPLKGVKAIIYSKLEILYKDRPLALNYLWEKD